MRATPPSRNGDVVAINEPRERTRGHPMESSKLHPPMPSSPGHCLAGSVSKEPRDPCRPTPPARPPLARLPDPHARVYTMLQTALPTTEVAACFGSLIDGQPVSQVLGQGAAPEDRGALLGLISRVDALRARQPRELPIRVLFESSHPELGGQIALKFPSLNDTYSLFPATTPPLTPPLMRGEAAAKTTRTPPPLPRGPLSSSSLMEACALLGLPEEHVLGGPAKAALVRAQSAIAQAATAVRPSTNSESLPRTPLRVREPEPYPLAEQCLSPESACDSGPHKPAPGPTPVTGAQSRHAGRSIPKDDDEQPVSSRKRRLHAI